MTGLNKNVALLSLEGVLKTVGAWEDLNMHVSRGQATYCAESGEVLGYTCSHAKMLHAKEA